MKYKPGMILVSKKGLSWVSVMDRTQSITIKLISESEWSKNRGFSSHGERFYHFEMLKNAPEESRFWAALIMDIETNFIPATKLGVLLYG